LAELLAGPGAKSRQNQPDDLGECRNHEGKNLDTAEGERPQKADDFSEAVLAASVVVGAKHINDPTGGNGQHQPERTPAPTRRRHRIEINRCKHVAGHAALKQFAIRPDGVFAVALWGHIKRSIRSPSDLELFNLGTARNETADVTPGCTSTLPDGSGRHSDLPARQQHSLSWLCAFCGQLKIFEGGRPLELGRLDDCATRGDRIANKLDDQAAVSAMIDQHLL
jgi:hypothetical protein